MYIEFTRGVKDEAQITDEVTLLQRNGSTKLFCDYHHKLDSDMVARWRIKDRFVLKVFYKQP